MTYKVHNLASFGPASDTETGNPWPIVRYEGLLRNSSATGISDKTVLGNFYFLYHRLKKQM